MNDVVFVTGNYPSNAFPNRGTFVQELVNTIAEEGVRCTVIHPLKVHEWWREWLSSGRNAVGGTSVTVYRPLMLSLSKRQVFGWNSFRITHSCFCGAVKRVMRKLARKPSAVYGHFLYSAGAAAMAAAEEVGCPGFVAVGEGRFWSLNALGVERARRDFKGMAGAIAVSRLIEKALAHEVGFPEHKLTVFPNGVDLKTFYPRDRQAMRRKYGLPCDRFLVAYVGNFIESKGVSRVNEALLGLDDVSGIYIGSGPLVPTGNNIAFCDRVSHSVVAELLSAADCFALPSDVEGSSNATLEAMACGLPVIVSDGAFNDAFFKRTVGLRVPSRSVTSIRKAVIKMRDDSARRAMYGGNARAAGVDLDIRTRARGILRWMGERARCLEEEGG